MQISEDESYTSKIVFEHVEANNVYTSGRDMYIGVEGREKFEAVRKALASADLPSRKRKQALRELKAAEEEANTEKPDRTRLRQRMDTLTRILRDSGVALTAGNQLAQSLSQLASWLLP